MIRMPCQLLFVRINFLACLIGVVAVGLLGGMRATGGGGELLPQAKKFKCFGGLVAGIICGIVDAVPGCRGEGRCSRFGHEIWVLNKMTKSLI